MLAAAVGVSSKQEMSCGYLSHELSELIGIKMI